jgi:hypothetical protein
VGGEVEKGRRSCASTTKGKSGARLMGKILAPYFFEESYHQNGLVFWYASDYLTSMLGYEEYTPAMKPIQKALQVCMTTNINYKYSGEFSGRIPGS